MKPETINFLQPVVSKNPIKVKEDKLKFNSLNETHIKHLRAMVASDRFSAGESVLDLHARDQSSHPPHRPEAVI